MMRRRFGKNYAILSIILDMIGTLLAFLLAALARIILPDLLDIHVTSQINYDPKVYVWIPILWTLVFLMGSVYDPQRTYRFTVEFRIVTVASVAATLACATILFITFTEFSRWLFLMFVFFGYILHLGWRLIFWLIRPMFLDARPERRVVIAGHDSLDAKIGKMIQAGDWTGMSLVGYLQADDSKTSLGDIPILGTFTDAQRIIRSYEIDDLIIAVPPKAYSHIYEIVQEVRSLPVNIRVMLDDYNLLLNRAPVEYFGGLPMIGLKESALSEWQRLNKRVFDLTISSAALLVLFPLFVLVAIAIKLDSRGPVLFSQLRVGEDGRLFRMYKFRSMIEDAEQQAYNQKKLDSQGNVIFKRKNDPRITRVGRFIRRTSLDELPQLINVLQGTMSLIGPRPEIPMMVGEYEPWQYRRFSVPQGMTGWWQINGRANKPMHLHTEDDIYYIKNYSLWMDIYILLKTPWIVIRGTGAY